MIIFSIIAYLLQNASQVPFGLRADKFLASLTKTCKEPFVEFRVKDFVLNFRKFKLLLPFEFDDELDEDAGGMNFRPTIISPL